MTFCLDINLVADKFCISQPSSTANFFLTAFIFSAIVADDVAVSYIFGISSFLISNVSEFPFFSDLTI